MKSVYWISSILLIFDLAVIAILALIQFQTTPITFSSEDVTPFIVIAGVLTALLTLAANQRRDNSEEYLENAVDLLAKAYDILDKSKDERGIPKNSRLNWLTSARLICTAENIAVLLIEESHKRIWEEKKEYWRGRLRDLILPNSDGFPETYYAANPQLMVSWGDKDQEPLSEKSLAVLYRFIQWPENMEDPLKSQKKFSENEIEKMATFGPKGLGRLFREVRKIIKQ